MSNFLSWSALILLFSLLSCFYLVVSSNSKKALIGANNEARYDQVYWVEQSGMSHKHAERETTFFISALTSSHGVGKASCVIDRCASHNGCLAVIRKNEKANCRHYHYQYGECNMTPKLQGRAILTFSPFLGYSYRWP